MFCWRTQIHQIITVSVQVIVVDKRPNFHNFLTVAWFSLKCYDSVYILWVYHSKPKETENYAIQGNVQV